jgi:putative membrane protein
MRASTLFFALFILSMPVYCLIRLSGHEQWGAISTAFTAMSFFAFSLAHCIETRGLTRATLMLFSGFAIALAFEYLGSSAGFLFGAYTYTDRLGPKAFGQVPIIVPVAWFMMLYPAWCVAELLVTQYGIRNTHNEWRGVAYCVLRIAIAALAMTVWDLSLDPRMVSDGNWIWPDGGAYFGVPLSNYAGWFVTAAAIYLAWSLLEIRDWRLGIDRKSPISNLQSQLPVWAYVVTWLGESMANALFWGGPAIALCVFVGMGLFGAPALFCLMRLTLDARAQSRAGRALAIRARQ